MDIIAPGDLAAFVYRFHRLKHVKIANQHSGLERFGFNTNKNLAILGLFWFCCGPWVHQHFNTVEDADIGSLW